MAKKTTKTTRKKPAAKTATKPAHTPRRSIFWFIGVMPFLLLRWGIRLFFVAAFLVVVLVSLYVFVNPPTTAYIVSEGVRLGSVQRQWRDFDEISEHMPHAIVAAEDANFCEHWGFDMGAIRSALEDGSGRGASTLSQQLTKNVFLWHGRNWLRKALEALITPLVELFWSKERILEVYMNVAEFDEGVFGVAEAAPWYFGVDAKDLTARQSALLAAILPNPKGRSAKTPSEFVQRRARSIDSGAQTIRADGRNACFHS